MKSLYNLTSDMLALMESEETTNEQIEAVFGEITAKENRICHFRAELMGEIDKFKAEEKRIATIRNAMENKAARLQEYIKQSMVSLGIDEITAGTFKLKLSPSVGSLEITDESAIPNKFKEIVQTVTVDKNAVKAAIKSGESVPGATIAEGWTLRIS